MRPWAHSIEIRERAMAALDKGELGVAEVAELFGVGSRTIYEWRRVRRERGSLQPLAHKSGNKPRVDEEGTIVVREILASEPDLTISEATVYFVERTARQCSPSSMGRALRRLGITRKKSP